MNDDLDAQLAALPATAVAGVGSGSVNHVGADALSIARLPALGATVHEAAAGPLPIEACQPALGAFVPAAGTLALEWGLPTAGAKEDGVESDGDMSAATPAEMLDRQAFLDAQASDFLIATGTGIFDENGNQIFGDGTVRPGEATMTFEALQARPQAGTLVGAVERHFIGAERSGLCAGTGGLQQKARLPRGGSAKRSRLPLEA